MSLNDTLERFEDLWRRAAVEDRRQFFLQATGMKTAGGGNEAPVCAVIIAEQKWLDGWMGQPWAQQGWTCPYCAAYRNTIIGALIHLNNVHEWTWDMLANKTRDVLRQGGVEIA